MLQEGLRNIDVPAISSGFDARVRAGIRPKVSWRCGGVACVAHVAAAFQFVHGWSHDAAWAATAAQVRSVTGWESGTGLWVNYAFTAGWVGVAVAWDRLPVWSRRVWEWVFAFMAFNGAVVFASGPARMAGWLLTGATLGAWLWRRRRAKGA